MKETNLTGILAGLLVLSIILNIVLLGVTIPALQATVTRLSVRTDTLSEENTVLQEQLDRQASPATPGGTTTGSPGRGSGSTVFTAGVTGFSSLQAPVVTRHIVAEEYHGFVSGRLVQEGAMTNISVEIRPGAGRVLVQTTPLMGIVFQDAANTAVAVAKNRTGADLSASDVIYSITAEHEVTAVDGPSAGALMAVITVAAIDGTPIDPTVTLTGTVDGDGHIGAISGVVEKATAAKAAGKRLLLLPAENRDLVRYTDQTVYYYGFSVIRRVPERVSARDYLEENVGIEVAFVDSLGEALEECLAQP